MHTWHAEVSSILHLYVALENELRFQGLQGRCFTHWAIFLAPYILFIFLGAKLYESMSNLPQTDLVSCQGIPGLKKSPSGFVSLIFLTR